MEDTSMFKIVNCGEEGGFWIEGPTGRMGVSFLVEEDADDYVEILGKGVEAERARLKKLAADANFAETSPFTRYKDEVAFMDGFAAGALAREAEIRREVLKEISEQRFNPSVGEPWQHSPETPEVQKPALLASRMLKALDRICPESP